MAFHVTSVLFGLACLLTTKSVATLLMPVRAGDAILKITGFRVPALVTYGSDVHLDCPFSTLPGRTKLYSVKWYHNSDEFYRFIFADPTPVFTFSLPGVKVDMDRSNSSRVTLTSVNFNTSGTFRCEVSADAPDFQTVHKRANMTIFRISDDGPLITGLRDRYEINEMLDINCSSPSMEPLGEIAAKHPILLALSFNDELVESKHIRALEIPYPADWTAVIRLRLNLTERHLSRHSGYLRLNCSLAIGRSPQHEHYVLFSRSLELKAALLQPGVTRRPPAGFPLDQRQNRGIGDYRSTSIYYSSSGVQDQSQAVVVLLSIILTITLVSSAISLR